VSSAAASLVRKLWHYCNILRDDGLSYPDYVEQLTYLLFLKMADESKDGMIPVEFSWRSFAHKSAPSLYRHYGKALEFLGKQDGTLGLIFKNARNKIKDPAKLRLLVVDLIGQTSWSRLSSDVKGDAYEGLLEKNAQDTKSGAGQYFTPRPLIEAMVTCVGPRPGEIICDPACGTGGFLIATYDYILKQNPELTPAQKRHLATKALRGAELVEEVARLATMNLLLHGIGGAGRGGKLPVVCEDSLKRMPSFKVDVVLTNPPFGIKGSVTYTRDERRNSDDLTIVRPDFVARTSNKQLNFVQHIMSILRPDGRAGIVIPDNVLFESGAAAIIRRRLLEDWNVHTLLRLPTGLFYAHGIKANVLFFDGQSKGLSKSKRLLWVYDLRQNGSFSVKTNPISSQDLDRFVQCCLSIRRSRNDGAVNASDHSQVWRAFPVDEILADNSCNLDLTWGSDAVRSQAFGADRIQELANLIEADLRKALQQINTIVGKH
jgi:type I restriction enzyme M protein